MAIKAKIGTDNLYWRVDGFMVSWSGHRASVYLAGYKDEKTADDLEGKGEAVVHRFDIGIDPNPAANNGPARFDELFQKEGSQHAMCYKAISVVYPELENAKEI